MEPDPLAVPLFSAGMIVTFEDSDGTPTHRFIVTDVTGNDQGFLVLDVLGDPDNPEDAP